MSNQRITFNPTAGVPYGVNLTLNTGSNFEVNFTTVDKNGSAFDFDSWTGSSQMTKSVSVGSTLYPHATFNFSFVSASNGQFKIALGSTQTRSLSEGRYYYDILVSSGTTVYKLVDGNLLVKTGISSAP
jgi:hypothetical protein